MYPYYPDPECSQNIIQWMALGCYLDGIKLWMLAVWFAFG